MKYKDEILELINKDGHPIRKGMEAVALFNEFFASVFIKDNVKRLELDQRESYQRSKLSIMNKETVENITTNVALAWRTRSTK